eukprot:gene8489-10434_t
MATATTSTIPLTTSSNILPDKPITSNYHYKDSNSTVSFTKETDGSLKALITTNKFIVKTVSSEPKEKECIYKLFEDPISTKLLWTGKFTREDVDKILDKAYKGWKNNDPASPLVVFSKQTQEFVGILIVERTEEKDQVELSTLLDKKFWGARVASELTDILHNCYADAIKKEGFSAIKSLYVTSRIDNPASNQLIEKMGFNLIGQKFLKGAMRNVYTKKI